MDRQGDLGAPEGRVALGDDRNQEDAENEAGHRECRDAVEPEPELGRMAPLQPGGGQVGAADRDGGPRQDRVSHIFPGTSGRCAARRR